MTDQIESPTSGKTQVLIFCDKLSLNTHSVESLVKYNGNSFFFLC